MGDEVISCNRVRATVFQARQTIAACTKSFACARYEKQCDQISVGNPACTCFEGYLGVNDEEGEQERYL